MSEATHIFGTKKLEGDLAFDGEIIDVSWVDGDWGEQLQLSIDPISYQGDIQTPRYKYSKKLNSTWGALQEALERIGRCPKESEQELVGMKAHFESKKIIFGKDKEEREMSSKPLLPMYLLDKPKGGSSSSEINPDLILKTIGKGEMKTAVLAKKLKCEKSALLKILVQMRKDALLKLDGDTVSI